MRQTVLQRFRPPMARKRDQVRVRRWGKSPPAAGVIRRLRQTLRVARPCTLALEDDPSELGGRPHRSMVKALRGTESGLQRTNGEPGRQLPGFFVVIFRKKLNFVGLKMLHVKKEPIFVTRNCTIYSDEICCMQHFNRSQHLFYLWNLIRTNFRK